MIYECTNFAKYGDTFGPGKTEFIHYEDRSTDDGQGTFVEDLKIVTWICGVKLARVLKRLTVSHGGDMPTALDAFLSGMTLENMRPTSKNNSNTLSDLCYGRIRKGKDWSVHEEFDFLPDVVRELIKFQKNHADDTTMEARVDLVLSELNVVHSLAGAVRGKHYRRTDLVGILDKDVEKDGLVFSSKLLHDIPDYVCSMGLAEVLKDIAERYGSSMKDGLNRFLDGVNIPALKTAAHAFRHLVGVVVIECSGWCDDATCVTCSSERVWREIDHISRMLPPLKSFRKKYAKVGAVELDARVNRVLALEETCCVARAIHGETNRHDNTLSKVFEETYGHFYHPYDDMFDPGSDEGSGVSDSGYPEDSDDYDSE